MLHVLCAARCLRLACLILSQWAYHPACLRALACTSIQGCRAVSFAPRSVPAIVTMVRVASSPSAALLHCLLNTMLRYAGLQALSRLAPQAGAPLASVVSTASQPRCCVRINSACAHASTSAAAIGERAYSSRAEYHATTILCVRKEGKVRAVRAAFSSHPQASPHQCSMTDDSGVTVLCAGGLDRRWPGTHGQKALRTLMCFLMGPSHTPSCVSPRIGLAPHSKRSITEVSLARHIR